MCESLTECCHRCRRPILSVNVFVTSNTFPIMNGIMWKGRSSEREPGSFDFAEGQTRSNPAMRVMDIYPMSVKRGDAHLSEWNVAIRPVLLPSQELIVISNFSAPPSDCLHWCTTGPQDPWNDLFFHMLLDESLNQDYEG
jgi:hypothetical protein